ncbi:MAG TPA: DUF1499 domain-containing protein [Longimicrobium sp.]|jgi:uncharacterized protein (DUF1499 family)|uniref:DUF1499 domain-containing protein n=1 Tax=Longimicrobium sp. TaxID=2029185 RepID=UPI002ED77DE6
MADLDIERTGPRRNPLAAVALALALLAVLLLLLSGPGTRMGLWDFRMGFSLMRWAAYAGIAAVIAALLAMAVGRRHGIVISGIALVLGALAFLLPWNMARGARAYPGIHDITTDTRNPPAFVAVVPLRKDAPNPPEYLGDSIAQIQQKAYPDLRPLMMAMPVDSAFANAVSVARDMGWEVVDQSRQDGRIEATATTPWFGFKDDVVVRVTSASGISRVDVRSKSRVGRGDVGANAKRIRDYLKRLRATDPQPVNAR